MEPTSTKNKISTKITNKTPFDHKSNSNSNSPNSSYSDVPLDSNKNLSTDTNVSGTNDTDTDKSILHSCFYSFFWFDCCICCK